MKKKTIAILLVLALLIAAGVYIGMRYLKHGTDIIGVTTLPDKNTVIMNSKTGSEFVSGSGTITVSEGEHIQLSYKLSSGSFDIAFDQGKEAVLEAVENMETNHLDDIGDIPAEHVIEQTGFEGSGDAQFEAAAGEYTVYFTMHDAIGTATVSTKKD